MTKKAAAILEKIALSPEGIGMRVGGFFNRRMKTVDRMLASSKKPVRDSGKRLENWTLGRIQKFDDTHMVGTPHNERYQRTITQMIPDGLVGDNRPRFKNN